VKPNLAAKQTVERSVPSFTSTGWSRGRFVGTNDRQNLRREVCCPDAVSQLSLKRTPCCAFIGRMDATRAAGGAFSSCMMFERVLIASGDF
jgi:hypothetical protein